MLRLPSVDCEMLLLQPIAQFAKAAGWSSETTSFSKLIGRYALVGLGNGAIFALMTQVFISLLATPAPMAAGFGYLCSIPFGFIGHRNFTFRSSNSWEGEAIRFVVVHAICFATSIAIMAYTENLQLPHYFGLLGTVVVVPILNFFVCRSWVFASNWKSR